MINTFCVLLKILSLPQYHKNVLLYVIISMLCDFDFHIYIYCPSKFIFVCELGMKVDSVFSYGYPVVPVPYIEKNVVFAKKLYQLFKPSLVWRWGELLINCKVDYN